ncbi:hypothetical protein EJ03DRAFT_392496 [Teratosphaeria nubilosa]|uniref:F-box domain-containing protein n=1 Tax=Teratosphaeria nubilosa TaxID=161662 RepID=A0A6G1KTG7_9PEZI|nr:hypothetical protein EJ03DRAFT_392496 [Teratosphaeria nubilosa]
MNARSSRKVEQRGGDHVLASLRATQILAAKPALPAELLAAMLDHLPVPELMRCARVSRQLHEMVHDDTRWVQKLRAMAAWNEADARQRFEEAVRRKTEGRRRRREEEAAQGTGVEERRGGQSVESPRGQRKATWADGFDDLTPSPPSPPNTAPSAPGDPTLALTVFARVRSIRGFARHEFGRVYAALGPLYNDLVRARGHSDAVIFRTYKDPEQQAQILANLKRFAACDVAPGSAQREAKLDDMMAVFENAVLREFEQGCLAQDVTGRMHRYAHVLVAINGGAAAVDSFISNHPIMTGERRLGNPLDCLDAVAPGHVDLNPSQSFFEALAGMLVEQAHLIDSVFPPTIDVLTPLLSRICHRMIAGYLTALLDEAHARGVETYVKAVSGTFEQARRLVASLKPSTASPPDFADRATAMVTQCYEKHIDLYLAGELAVFRLRAEGEVAHWEKELSDQQATAESFFMSNINRQAAKRDFLSSFKKVVMMPVNVLPAFPLSLSSKAASTTPANASTANLASVDTAYPRPRPQTPPLTRTNTPMRSSTPAAEAPTTELAAKAAIMNSRLEGIKSLFSIEVALNLTHYAKASLERAARMVQMGGKHGEEAKEQCRTIFVTLLSILGDRHVKNGFDKAVGHLGDYHPRQVREFRAKAAHDHSPSRASVGVEPLVTFLELVNVGDLIQQMLDVFYAQELIATHLTDRDDFLDPAVKAKKHFEQMLDARVAAGLNKGIDVLMDQVEHICAATQSPTDFNPSPGLVDNIGPSPTARQIVDLLHSHTSMLLGSSDKNLLDVFTQEIGLRLFALLCKHFKRQRISVDGAVKLIADINHYSAFISSLRQKPLLPYFHALRELGQIYLAQALAALMADGGRYCGVFAAEEVYEFAERRADWLAVRGEVERAMYGVGCVVV